MRVRSPAVLLAVIAVAAIAGVAISTAQRPPGAVAPPSLPPSAAPTPVPQEPISGIGFTVADDPASAEVVLFGGVDDYDNTWVWVGGGQWRLADPTISPPGRIDAAAAYDPQMQRLLLFGGRQAPYTSGPLLNDTWAWDGAAWSELDPGGATAPSPGEGATMAWDDALSEMVLVTTAGNSPGGDQTWIWSGTHWVHAAHGAVAPSAFDLPIAFDPVTRSLIAEGCCATPVSPLGALDITWRWNGTSWGQIPGTAEPLPGSSLALNPDTDQLALCNCGPMRALPALASWTGRTWSVMSVDRLPIDPDTMITEAGSGQLVIVGSASPSSPFVAQPIHIWGLEGTLWRQLDIPTAG
jgi:hypothetical protein